MDPFVLFVIGWVSTYTRNNEWHLKSYDPFDQITNLYIINKWVRKGNIWKYFEFKCTIV